MFQRAHACRRLRASAYAAFIFEHTYAAVAAMMLIFMLTLYYAAAV